MFGRQSTGLSIKHRLSEKHSSNYDFRVDGSYALSHGALYASLQHSSAWDCGAKIHNVKAKKVVVTEWVSHKPVTLNELSPSFVECFGYRGYLGSSR